MRRGAAFCQTIPLRRVGHAEEVAPMDLWLCTHEASYASGSFFLMDCGVMSV